MVTVDDLDLSCPDWRLIAAADHCLEPAYRGFCPGVDPDTLMAWRAESRAAHQGRTVDSVMADVSAARKLLLKNVADRGERVGSDYCYSTCDAPHADCYYGHERFVPAEYADLRGVSVPELPEAAAREGIPFLADQVDRDGRRKVVVMAAPATLVQRFLDGNIVPGLVDTYGDPARGFAGGYLP